MKTRFLKQEIYFKYNKLISKARNKLTNLICRIIINIGDANVKKRNVFIKNKRFL